MILFGPDSLPPNQSLKNKRGFPMLENRAIGMWQKELFT
jgi:hypothetical protein